MALITCPECGKQNVSDSAVACPECGFAIREHFENIKKEELKEKKDQEKREKTAELKQKTGKSKFPIIIIGVVACLVVAVVLLTSGNKEVRQIEKLMKANKYQEALECLYEAEDFEGKDSYITECMYYIAEEYYNNGEYLIALNMLKSNILSDNTNAKTLRKSIEDDKTKLVTIMEQAYEDGDFSTAIYFAENHFTLAEKNEYNISGLFKKCRDWEKVQGEYKYGRKTLIVSGYTYNEDGTQYKLVMDEEEPDHFYIDGDTNNLALLVEEGLIWQIKDDNFKARKEWETAEYSKERLAPYLEPAIGMTAEEVEKGRWGRPQDINKSTYAWGVHEQWCYPGHKYVYLENGIVTAIQE